MSETTTIRAELEPLLPGQLALVRKADFAVQDVANQLTEPVPGPADPDEPAIPFPPLPRKVELTDEARGALTAIPVVFGKVEMTERRILTPAELQELATELATIETVGKLAGDRKTAIQEMIRHHNDVTAEHAGQAFPRRRRVGSRLIDPTPRDKSGHYLLAEPQKPFITAVSGWAKGWEQRFVKGGTSQSKQLLEELLLSGKVTRAEYLGFTREVRELDEAKIRTFMTKNADRGLRILKAITIRSAPNSSLYGPSK